MTNKVPITYWYSSLGVGDGQDMATRGYLRALKAVGYEHILVVDRNQPVVFHAEAATLRAPKDEDLVEFEDLYDFPKHLRKELLRIQPGDPRIGQQWSHLPPETYIEVPSHAPSGALPAKWVNTIMEGEVDQDYYREHPEERNVDWTPDIELIVAHYDPGKLVRARDVFGAQSGGVTPVVGITAWEADKVPVRIAQQLSDLDLLVVPSEHTKAAFMSSGLECPVKVVPHLLLTKPLTAEEYEHSLMCPSVRYVFYTIGTNIPRKNLRGLIVAYCRAFAPDFEGVGLVIKTSGDPPSLKALYEDGVRASGCKSWPKIAIYGDKWPDAKIRELHLGCNCWVDATRGEGFGLPQLDACALGNPVITTAWGAQVEIIDSVNAAKQLVPFKLTPVDADMAKFGVYEEDQQWADPDLDALAKAMKDCVVDRWNKNFAQVERVATRYGVQVIGKTLQGALERVKRR